MKNLIILDRDGVINEDSDSFIKNPLEWIELPGAIEAIRLLNCSNWTVAIATNQSGVSRGLFDEQMLNSIHQKMFESLASKNAKIDFLAYCPHGPDDLCDCRKPMPGLYNKISEYFQCSLHNVPVIGDSSRDLEAAVAVGAHPILVLTGKGMKTMTSKNYPLGTTIYPDLLTAVQCLLTSSSSGLC